MVCESFAPVLGGGIQIGAVDGEDNRFQPVDQIAYSSQDILDAEQRLLAHSQRTGGPALTAQLVARHNSRKIRGVRLDLDQAVAITCIARSGLMLDLLVDSAGSGRTTALRALHRAWTAAHERDSVTRSACGRRTPQSSSTNITTGAGTSKLGSSCSRTSPPAGTLALDRITEHAAEVGAKVVLIGDWAQLSAVETGGAFGMLARHRQRAPELTDVCRFVNGREKTASLSLRHGNADALD